MIRILSILMICFISTVAYAQDGGILTDADMPAMRDALKKAYTPVLCQQDLPNATEDTCNCLRQAMADNLNVAKLKLCESEGYDSCVAAEFTAAKSGLTEQQIDACKALTPAAAATKPVEEEGEE